MRQKYKKNKAAFALFPKILMLNSLPNLINQLITDGNCFIILSQ